MSKLGTVVDRITDRDVIYFFGGQPVPVQPSYSELRERVAELETKQADIREAATNPTCSGCGGPHPYDTVVPSPLWNSVIRANNLPEYLCLTCITREFAKRGISFTATLVGDGLEGRIAIEVIVHGE